METKIKSEERDNPSHGRGAAALSLETQSSTDARGALLANDLPTLPDVALRAIRLAADPDWDLHQLSTTIGRDQGLAARFLRLANAALFGARGSVTTLDMAIVRVGITRVRSVVLAAALEAFHETKRSNFTGTVLWEHALGTACISQHLATTHRRCLPDEAFMAGLLHDIGRTLLDQLFPTEYARVLTLVENGVAPSLLRAEQQVLPFDHTELGFEAADAWEFPAAIAETIRHHHAPAEAVADPGLCATVSLANSLCLHAQLGPDLPPPDQDLATLPSAEILALDGAELDTLLHKVPRLIGQVWSVRL